MPPGPQGRRACRRAGTATGCSPRAGSPSRSWCPGTTEDLVAQGALLRDAQAEGRWHLAGGPLAAGTSALPMLLVSRPRLEWYLRQRLTARPGVEVLEQTAVLDLAFSADERRVVGVVVRDRDGGEAPARCGRPRRGRLGAHLAHARVARSAAATRRRAEEVRRVDKNSVTRVFRDDPARRRPAAIAVARAPGAPAGRRDAGPGGRPPHGHPRRQPRRPGAAHPARVPGLGAQPGEHRSWPTRSTAWPPWTTVRCTGSPRTVGAATSDLRAFPERLVVTGDASAPSTRCSARG